MNTKLAACLLAVALLACLVFAATRGHERAKRPVEESSGPAPAAEPLARPEVELAAGAASPPAPSPVPLQIERAAVESTAAGSERSELAGLTGRVVESDGTPVAGIRVALLAFEASLLFDGSALDEEEPSLEIEETVTDASGRFDLGGADQQSFTGLGVDLGGPRSTIRVVDQALVHRERTDVGDVVLAPFGVLTGRVLDEGGAPLAGARIRCAPLPAEILKGQPQEFRSDSCIALNRMMMGGQGQAIVELPAWVRAAIERLPVPTTTSGGDGTFRLAGVSLAEVVGGVDLRGYVGHPFGPLDMTGGAQDLGTVVLKRGRTVRGVVEEPDGEPVAGAEVQAGAELVPGFVAVLQSCGPTDEEGRFELTGVAETGQIVAAARRAPHETWSTTVAARPDGVLIEMESLVRLTVNVRDEAGNPLSGADLRLTPALQAAAKRSDQDALAFLPRPSSPRGSFTEVEAGRYALAGLGAGRYELTARVAGRSPGFLEADCLASENDVTLVCPQGRRIELTVVAAGTREPIAGATASILRAASSGFAKLGVARTDAAGKALLGPLAALPGGQLDFFPAQWLLLVEHPRHGSYSSALDPSASTMTVVLFAGGTLAGRVHWGGAVPTRVYMLSLQYREAEDLLGLFHLPRFAVTGIDGGFRCANLAPGTYGVTLTDRFLQQDPLGMIAAEYEPPTLYRGEVEIRDGQTTELEIDLTPTGRGATASVVGRVRFEGRGLEGAAVAVSGNEQVKASTDAGGRFETAPFSVRGPTMIRIDGDVPLGGGATRHLQLYEESVELVHGDVHRIDLDLYPLTVRARVVAAADERPVPAAKVSAELQREGKGRMSVGESAPTDGAGDVELLVLEPGEYVLSASAEGFTRGTCTVKVGAEGASEPGLVRLQRPVPCAGRVLPGAVEAGPRRFSYMWVQSEDGSNSSGTQIEAPDYAFSFEDLPPGKYTAHVYLDGRPGEVVTFELGQQGDERLELAYTPEEIPKDE